MGPTTACRHQALIKEGVCQAVLMVSRSIPAPTDTLVSLLTLKGHTELQAPLGLMGVLTGSTLCPRTRGSLEFLQSRCDRQQAVL